MPRKSQSSLSDGPASNPSEASAPPISPAIAGAAANPFDVAELDRLLDLYAEPIAVATIRERLPEAVGRHMHRILTSQRPEDRAQLQEILRSIGVVIAAHALQECLNHACLEGRERLTTAVLPSSP